MSMIMASTRAAMKAQKTKAKAKAWKKAAAGNRNSTAQQQSFNPTPPLSSARTAVWHWILDGVPTTVMLNKETSEVWCNGVVLETIDGFVDEEGDAGGVVDFCIYMEDTNSTHKARIKRYQSQDARYGMAYDLFVDGYQIDEHVGNGQQYQEQYTEQYTEQYAQYDQEQVAYDAQYGAGSNEMEGQQYDPNAYDPNGYATYDEYGNVQAAPTYGLPGDQPPAYDEAVAEDKKTQ